MRIHIWKEDGGRRKAMVVPGRSAHLAPIVVLGSDRDPFLAELAAAVEVAARAELPRAVVTVA